MFLYSSAGSQSLMVRSEEQEARSVPPLGPPKSQSSTALVCPFTVRSSSPSSQSQILRVVSSDPEAREEKIGWKATQFTGPRCDCSVCLAGARGSHDTGSMLRREREVGVAESSSDWSTVLRDSRSIIFFCRRTTEVHFFSRRPSYFLEVSGVNVSPMESSSRSAAALVGRLATFR